MVLLSQQNKMYPCRLINLQQGGRLYKGIYTPIITVFRDGAIDYEAQTRLVERQIQAGVDGILFCGSIGEFHAMKLADKKEYFRWAGQMVAGRVKVLAGTGGTCIEDVMDLTSFAADHEIDGAIVISPYYFQLGHDDLYRYYETIATIGLPIILYNFPDRTGISMTPTLVRELATNFKEIVGIKDTVDSISHTREVINAVKSIKPEFAVLSGYDEYLVPNLLAGGDGVLAGMTNVAPTIFVSLRKAFLEGNIQMISQQTAVINKLMRLYSVTNPFITAIKEAVNFVVGNISTDVLPPARKANLQERDQVMQILGEINQTIE